MQQFILEELLEVFCDEDGRWYKDIVELENEGFIQVMLRIHQPFEKMEIFNKNAKM